MFFWASGFTKLATMSMCNFYDYKNIKPNVKKEIDPAILIVSYIKKK